MDLRSYLSSLTPEQKQDLAERARTKVSYLYVLACEQDKPDGARASPALARRLVEASDGELSLHALRPDVWDAA